jgi:hypothetical protein
MPITEEQIARAKAAHPGVELHLISNDDLGVEIMVRAPNEGEYKRFRTMHADEAQRSAASRALVLGCIVEPPPSEFTAMLASRPALADTFANDLVEIAGLSRANTRRKV